VHQRTHALDRRVEAHFFDVYDYLNARAALAELNVDAVERKPVDASRVRGVGADGRADVSAGITRAGISPDITLAHLSPGKAALPRVSPREAALPGGGDHKGKVLSVWVHCKRIVNTAKYPAGSDDIYWTASFDMPASLAADLRGEWHALAVSVSPADGGVTAYVDAEMLATRRLPEGAVLHVDPDDARFALANFGSRAAWSGRFRNLAVYSRALRVLEAQTMTTLSPLPPRVLNERNPSSDQKTTPVEAEEEEEEEEAEARFETVVLASDPDGYWPMQETQGSLCADKSRVALSNNTDANATHAQDVGPARNLMYESRFAGGLSKNDTGPPRVGGMSVCLQGGTIRSSVGGMCKVGADVGGSPVTHPMPDVTFEVFFLCQNVFFLCQNCIFNLSLETYLHGVHAVAAFVLAHICGDILTPQHTATHTATRTATHSATRCWHVLVSRDILACDIRVRALQHTATHTATRTATHSATRHLHMRMSRDILACDIRVRALQHTATHTTTRTATHSATRHLHMRMSRDILACDIRVRVLYFAMRRCVVVYCAH